ncbi:MAG: trypsin-like peptidase domain-containing protein [Dehalococcoidia bacterium]|nr:trypsin-like peptidase domain-containing protein [Dehalococcoidia bacterium]
MLKRYRVVLFLTLMVASAAALSACDLGSSPQDSPAPATALTVPAESAPTVESVVQKSAPAPELGTESRPGLWAQVLVQAPITVLAKPTQTPEPTVSASPTQAPEPPSAPSPTQAPAPTSGPIVTAAASPTQEPDTEMVIEGTRSGSGAAVVSLNPAAAELTTVDVVKILKPSIVQIVSELAAMGFSNSALPPTGVGTGVILDQQGHILTNNHVIEDAQRLTVTLENGESFPAQIVGRDDITDLAVIRIQADGLQPAKLGVSAEVEVGQDVIAIGHALGLPGGPTVSKGVVSALARSINTEQNNTIVDLIQTDASINPGNSGGALANTASEVIGINTAIIQGGQGIGFAINIDDAKVVTRQLMDQGFVRRGFLGITPVNLTPSIANQLGLDINEGVILARIIEDTAAAEADLRVNDVIVRLGNESIGNTGELSKFLIAHQPGETVDIVIIRDGREVVGELTLRDRPG